MARLIKYRGIIHERCEDAPFMGALIIAENCSNNCQGCFNQHLKETRVFEGTAEEIIEIVKDNLFNDGIILAGLEWSEQPEDVIELVKCAKKNHLEVMIYTGLSEEGFAERLWDSSLTNCYVKFGMYDANYLSDDYYSLGVKLASTNQYVKLFK